MAKTTDTNNHIIELVDVCKEFDGVTIVENINFYVRKGEFITFLGPSGCGKTTTLRMIAGFEMPTSGKILFNGEDISHLPPNKRPVNTVFQKYALFPHLNVFENIAFGLKLQRVETTVTDKHGNTKIKYKKIPKAVIAEKVRKALDVVDLVGFEKRSISTLSGGQQQRIASARAIVNEPQILLLDEPLGALDLKMRKEMQLELKAMHKRLGITFIYVTHDQEEALTMSDTIMVMSDGMIQQIGTPEMIYNEPKNTFVADFIGESNIIDGIMNENYKVSFSGHTFECLDEGFGKNEPVDVVIRPEDVDIVPADKGMLSGKVTQVTFMGVHNEIIVDIGGFKWMIQTTDSVNVDEHIGISLDPDAIHIMKKSKYSGMFGDYSSYSNEIDELTEGGGEEEE